MDWPHSPGPRGGRDVNPSAGCALEALARVVQYASSPDFNSLLHFSTQPDFLPPRQTSPIHSTSLTSSYIRTLLAQLPPHNNTLNMVKAGAGSQNNHSLAVNSSLTFCHHSRRWCRWWYRTGEHPTAKALTCITSLTLPPSLCPSSSRPARSSTSSPSTMSSTPPAWPPTFLTSPPSPRSRASFPPTMA
jgi:hypothetical protein